MLFRRFESEGLAHYSYIIGDGTGAAVIDPRRDIGDYLAAAAEAGTAIRLVLETHRHEDFVSGARHLAARTGAAHFHGDAGLDYEHGAPASDGQRWTLGGLTLETLATPGHTPGSVSYLAREPGGEPWMVFTGDALFAGDVGRTDLLGMDRARELAGTLHDSIFGRILPLGDGVLMWPAHGAGSSCGAGIASRERTTLGLERRLNPKLQMAGREEFIDAVAKELPRPSYFREMERVNLAGGPAAELPVLEPLAPDEFAGWLADAQVLDARPAAAFAAAHVPGALSAWPDGVASYAGWFLDFDRPVALVAGAGQERIIQRRLARLGFERLVGFLAGGIVAWLTAGRAAAATRTVTVDRLCEELDEGGDAVILDVRGREEAAAAGEIPGARLVPLTELADRLDELDREEELTVFCGTGLRSMIAASLLEQRVFRRVRVALGGLRGWRSRSCPVKLASD